MSGGVERSIIVVPMQSETPPNRVPQLAGSAATIIAMLSMVTMVSVMPASRTVMSEARCSQSETPSMREVAVAMAAAAARDLLGNDRLDTVLASCEAAEMVELQARSTLALNLGETPCFFTLPDELLIDLPPPGC